MNLAPQLVKAEDHSPSYENGTLSTVNVLVIDHSFDGYLAIARFLRMPYRQRYKAVHCETFEQGIAEMQSKKFDVALLGHQLGDQCGIDLIKAFDGNPPLPVIVLTGCSAGDFSDIESDALESGAYDILDKNDLSCAALTRSIGFACKRFETEWEIRQREAEIRKAHEKAEAAHFSKSEFLAHLSHELRTPLNAIIGFSQVLKDDTMNLGMDDKYQDYADTVHKSGLHLLDMFNDLLELTQTDTDAYDARMERFKRYRTWILDREEARRAFAKTTKTDQDVGSTA